MQDGFVVRCYSKGTARHLVNFLVEQGATFYNFLEEQIKHTGKGILIGVNRYHEIVYSHDINYMNTEMCRKYYRCYKYSNDIIDILLEKEGDFLNDSA